MWGFFIVIGCPIYAIFTGRIILYLVSGITANQEKRILLKPWTNDEFYFASSFSKFFSQVHQFGEPSKFVHRNTGENIPTIDVDSITRTQQIIAHNGDDENVIGFAEFVILQLVRLGKKYSPLKFYIN